MSSEAHRRAARKWAQKSYEKDPEKYRASSAKYRRENPGKAYEQTKRWRRENPEAHRRSAREYAKRRRREDPNFRLAHNLRSRLGCFAKGRRLGGSAVRET